VRVPIRFGRLRPLFVVLGLAPGRSHLDLEPDTVQVRMSWGFSADIPRASIRSAVRAPDEPGRSACTAERAAGS
jgi:hypothetical protein